MRKWAQKMSWYMLEKELQRGMSQYKLWKVLHQARSHCMGYKSLYSIISLFELGKFVHLIISWCRIWRKLDGEMNPSGIKSTSINKLTQWKLGRAKNKWMGNSFAIIIQ